VVANCVEVIKGTLTAGDGVGAVVFGRNEDVFVSSEGAVGGDGGVVDKEGRHIECLWEVDTRLILLLAVGTLVLEALEVQDEHFWRLVYLDDLPCLLVLLAGGTIPLIATF
jgi:hypothetical protein